MSDQQVANVKPVSLEEADGKVKEIYEDIMTTKGIDFVPNIWRVMATNPGLLENVWTLLKYWMHPEQSGREPRLDAATREMIALAVSASNGCRYCVMSHSLSLKKTGADDDLIGEVMAIAGLFNMTNSLADGYQVEPDVRPSID
mgnify:CR=1 FL=1|jgi:AhpD family alkylhydroperoxidase